MNQKELNELRRRWKPDKNAISRIYGCFVNSNKEIITDLDESLGMMTQEEAEKYLSLLKKALSGALGKNLIDIVFSNQQVMTGEEHRMLMELLGCGRHFIRKLFNRWTWARAIICCCWQATATMYPNEITTPCEPRARMRSFPTFCVRSARLKQEKRN